MRRAAAPLAALALLAGRDPRADDPTPVRLEAGETVNVCQTGLALCPVSTFLCDDPGIAVVENGPEGALLKGVSPGTTLCSVLGPGRAFRRLLRVTVHAGNRP